MKNNLKDLFDQYFLNYYNVTHSKIKPINAKYTDIEKFDLIDSDTNFVINFGTGTGSFENKSNHEIEVLAYNCIMKFYNSGNYNLLNGAKCCDFILYNKENAKIIFNEHTTSSSGVDNLKTLRDSKTGITKFEKAEIQLSNSVEKMKNIKEIDELINNCPTKICLCSYKLYTGNNSTQKAFNRGISLIDKEVGEDGAIFSSPDIEKYGFEFRRISHNYAFNLS